MAYDKTKESSVNVVLSHKALAELDRHAAVAGMSRIRFLTRMVHDYLTAEAGNLVRKEQEMKRWEAE